MRPTMLNARAQGRLIALVVLLAVVIIAAAMISAVNTPSKKGTAPVKQVDEPSFSANNTSAPPGLAAAQVVVVIHSAHLMFKVHYKLYLNAELMAEGDVAARSSVMEDITVIFPADQVGLFKAVLLATSTGGGLGAKSAQAIITPENNGTYPVTLEV